MSLPNYQQFMHPLLESIKSGEIFELSEIRTIVFQRLELTEQQLADTISSGKRTVANNRIGWSRTYLHKAGLLSIPKPGTIQITERGSEALASGESITNQYLKQFPEFMAFIRPAKSSDTDAQSAETIDNSQTPDDQIEQAYQAITRSLASDLLEQIKASSPQFFEKLVIDLMLAMGYGGSRSDAGQATQYTNDGGIDGTIKEDPLGLDTIYLQAKRYTDSKIGRPELQAFAGALDMKRAKKGVFITTSSFSRDAWEYVDLIEKSIILIDGEKLAELMIQYNLAVTSKQSYAIKAIDSDYFNED